MDETVNKFLLAGDRFMPEMNIKQPGFPHNACESFTKNKEKIQNNRRNRRYKKQEIQTIFTKINLIKLVFNMI